VRQQSKAMHKINEVEGISFFAMIANANDPYDIEFFGKDFTSVF